MRSRSLDRALPSLRRLLYQPCTRPVDRTATALPSLSQRGRFFSPGDITLVATRLWIVAADVQQSVATKAHSDARMQQQPRRQLLLVSRDTLQGRARLA